MIPLSERVAARLNDPEWMRMRSNGSSFAPIVLRNQPPKRQKSPFSGLLRTLKCLKFKGETGFYGVRQIRGRGTAFREIYGFFASKSAISTRKATLARETALGTPVGDGRQAGLNIPPIWQFPQRRRSPPFDTPPPSGMILPPLKTTTYRGQTTATPLDMVFTRGKATGLATERILFL